MQVFTLLADLENNRLASPEVRRGMQELLDEIGQLDRKHLTAIDHDLVEAAQARRRRRRSPRRRRTGRRRRCWTRGLPPGPGDCVAGGLLGRMNQWGSYRRFYHDVEQLLRDQELLAHEAAEVGRLTLTKDLKDLQPQEAADLKVLAQRQLDCAAAGSDLAGDGRGRCAVEAGRPFTPLLFDPTAGIFFYARASEEHEIEQAWK